MNMSVMKQQIFFIENGAANLLVGGWRLAVGGLRLAVANTFTDLQNNIAKELYL
jgi:hypothetical protein